METPRGLKPAALWFVLLAIGFALYGPGLTAPYFADDYQFVFDQPGSKLLHYFTHANDQNGFYRPLQATFLVVIQTVVGMSTWPIHVVQILLHVLLAGLVAIALRDLGFSRWQGGIGALFMLVSQANVHAVQSNDTVSQIGGTLFGFVSLWLLFRAFRSRIEPGSTAPPARICRLALLGSLLAFTVSLLCKETSVGFLPMLIGLACLVNWRRPRGETRWLAAITAVGVFALIAGGYLAIRSTVATSQAALGDAGYNFRLGANIIRNLGMFGFAMSVPISSVKAFVLLKGGLWAAGAAIGLLILAFLSLIGCGWLLVERRGLLIWLLLFVLLGLCPAVFLNHVSELYAYNAMPFWAMIVGIGLGALWSILERQPVGAFAGLALAAALTLSHGIAVVSKVRLMDANGRSADHLIEQIRPLAESTSEGQEIWLLNPPPDRIEYSVFNVTGFKLLANALGRLPQLWQRPDLTMRIVLPKEMADLTPPPGTRLLALEGDQVDEWRLNDLTGP